jgi:hypothetical protein
MIMNDKLGRTWKEQIKAYFKNLTGGGGTAGIFSHLAEIWTWDHQNTKQE